MTKQLSASPQRVLTSHDTTLSSDSTTPSRDLPSSSHVLDKALLVARGNLQWQGIDYNESYAPVIKFVSLCILLIWAHLSTPYWVIVSAFLPDSIDMDIYMYHPQGFSDRSNHVCHLKKALYALCQAAWQFYICLNEIPHQLHFTYLAADWA